MSQPFVTAFLTTCFDAGISEASAAELLQKESVARAMHARPAFEEGYRRVASRVPGGLNPMLRGVVLEKSANTLAVAAAKAAPGFWRHGKDLIGHVGGALGSLFGMGAKGLQSAGKAVLTTAGPGKKSWLSRYPFPTAMGLAGITGLGAYKANDWINGTDRLTAGPGVGGDYDQVLQQKEPEVFRLNQAYDDANARVTALEQKSSNGNTLGGTEYQELARLRRTRDAAEKARNAFTSNTQNAQQQSVGRISEIDSAAADLENQRTSMLYAPKRWLMQARAGNLFDGNLAQQQFDKEIGALQEARKAHSNVDRSSNDVLKMMQGRATGRAVPLKTQQQLTSQFFPAYNN